MQNFSNARGFLLVETMMASVVASAIAFGFSTAIAKQTRISNAMAENMIAQSHAEQLGEMLRGIKPSDMTLYLSNLTESPAPCLRLAGDYNGDAKVDGGDYTTWRAVKDRGRYFTSVDGNGDGVIDWADYDVYRANLDNVSLCGVAFCPVIPGDADRDGDIDNADLAAAVGPENQEMVRKQLGRVSTCGAPIGEPPQFSESPKTYRLCEKISSAPADDPNSKRIYSDYVADLPPNTGLKSAWRSYKVQIVDLSTLEVKSCGSKASERTPASNEVYMATVEVLWSNGKKVVLNSILPRVQ